MKNGEKSNTNDTFRIGPSMHAYMRLKSIETTNLIIINVTYCK